MTDGNRPKSNFEVVIYGAMKKAIVFIGDSMVRETNKTLDKCDVIVVYLQGQ